MKQIYSTLMMLAMMVAALSFTACGGADDEEVDNNSIVGVWECTSMDYSNVFGDDEYEDEEELKVGERLTIKSDGTYSEPNDSGRWSLHGNQLTCISNDEYSIPAVYIVSKLTSKELVLTIDYGIFKATIKFKRVS